MSFINDLKYNRHVHEKANMKECAERFKLNNSQIKSIFDILIQGNPIKFSFIL